MKKKENAPLDDLTVYALRAAMALMLFAFFMLEPESPLDYAALVVCTVAYIAVESARRGRERDMNDPDDHY